MKRRSIDTNGALFGRGTSRNTFVIVPLSRVATHPPPAGSATERQHVFAYGTLVAPQCLDEVLGHKHAGERLRARLTGFQRVTSEAYPYPYIVEADGRWVDGVLLTDLSPGDVQALDRYEEVETGVYRRQLVEVEAWTCGPRPLRLEAQTYVAGPGLMLTTESEPERNL